MRVTADEERAVIVDVLAAQGVDAARAMMQAEWLVEGDLRGHPSHGIQRLPVIVGRISSGLTCPNAEPLLCWSSPSALAVDGAHGLGPCVGLAAVGALIERSRQTGVAVAAVHNANHLGLLAPYVEQIATSGLVGVALTTSEALVHPWGGRTAMLGTNPIAIAIPAAPEPFVLDMATGAVSMGKLINHRGTGVPLSPGWAIDARGAPTLDAAAATAISPFGGAKGFALGLAFELFVAVLTGTALGSRVKGTLDTTTACNKGDVFLSFDPSSFGSNDWAEPVNGYLAELRGSPAQPGTEGVSVPGDQMRRRRSQHLKSSIEIPDPVWAAATNLLASR